jgi:hypothetical protein
MAFYDQNDEEQIDPNAAPAAAPTAPGSAVISGQGAGDSGGVQPASSATGSSNPGNNFVGIRQYIDANKPQSEKLGNEVAGKVQGVINTANEDVSALQGQFKSLADQGQIANAQGAENEAKSIVNQAATGAAGQNINDQSKQRYGEIANASYRGPDKLEDTELYQPAYAKLSEAQKYADLSKDSSGTQQLMQELYKSPKNLSGASRLDSYLLNSDSNKEKLAQAREQVSGLNTNFQNVSAGAADYAKQQKDLAEQIRASAQKYLTGTSDSQGVQQQKLAQVQNEINKIQYGPDGIANTADDATGGWDSTYNKLIKDLGVGGSRGSQIDLTPEQAALLGVSEGSNVFNELLNPGTFNQYVSKQVADPNKLVSKDEQAQLAALDALAQMYGAENINPYTMEDLAGTQSAADSLKFNAADFKKANEQRQNEFNYAVSQINTPGGTFGGSGIAGALQDLRSAFGFQNMPVSTPEDVRNLLNAYKGNWWYRDVFPSGGGTQGAQLRIAQNWLANYDRLANTKIT